MESNKPTDALIYHGKKFLSLLPATAAATLGGVIMFSIKPEVERMYKSYSFGVETIGSHINNALDSPVVSNDDIADLVRDVYKFAMAGNIDPSRVPELSQVVDNLSELSKYSKNGIVDAGKAKTYLFLSKCNIYALQDRLENAHNNTTEISYLLGGTLMLLGGLKILKEFHSDAKIAYGKIKNTAGFWREYLKQKRESKEQ